MRAFLQLLAANLKLEFRVKETAVLMLTLAIMLSVVVSLGLGSALFDSKTRFLLFPALIWVVFLFSATVSIGRSFEYEIHNAALDGVILSGTSPVAIYLSKATFNLLVMLVSHVCAFFCLCAFLNVDLFQVLPEFLIVSLLVLLGYSALATLLSAISISSKLHQILLPLLLLPLIFPLFFCAIELTFQLTLNRQLDFSSVWFSLLVGIDVVYLALGINLFEYAIKE
ncbi:MAG: hypothetical protein DCC75_02575 [Proteobacteria bacterium]|nr:MAG: hypothetical protein DCC75_02575 [Pseudomonadota bacterium]